MLWIDESWLRMAFEALQESLRVDPRARQDMIQFLLDEGFWDGEKLTFPAAETRFANCLNPNKSEFFKLGEIWALMKRFGRHQLLLAMADDLGYELRRKPTEERRQELLERIATASENCERAVSAASAELARIDAPAPGKPRALGARPQFSMDDTRTGVP